MGGILNKFTLHSFRLEDVDVIEELFGPQVRVAVIENYTVEPRACDEGNSLACIR
jgi:hypothetical protein